jgi:hypothetical protein
LLYVHTRMLGSEILILACRSLRPPEIIPSFW